MTINKYKPKVKPLTREQHLQNSSKQQLKEIKELKSLLLEMGERLDKIEREIDDLKSDFYEW